MVKQIMLTIYSGGQTGVDRAVLDAILHYNNPDKFRLTGWCPKGRLAEDGPIPEKYPLQETETENYSERTEWNIRDSDAILILFKFELDSGTEFAMNKAKDFNKHIKVINLSTDQNLPELLSWIVQNGITKLNIGGPREGNCDGIYKLTYQLMTDFARAYPT